METEILSQAVQGGMWGAMAIWLIIEGRKMTKESMDRQDAHMAKLVTSYEKQQSELVDLLKSLCLPGK